MSVKTTFAERVLQFNADLSGEVLELPEGFKFINPFKGEQEELVQRITTAFYEKYYSDCRTRRLILGSSPARRGSAITGVPFEDAKRLQMEFGVLFDKFWVNQSSSGFLQEVVDQYGGFEKFYSDFFMSFICPFGLVRITPKGKEANCNYYENKKLQEALYPFIVKAIYNQLKFGIDTCVCYCIGSGENYRFLSKLNNEHRFFEKIIPLEHPRFIMQYNSRKKDIFVEKYLNAFMQ